MLKRIIVLSLLSCSISLSGENEKDENLNLTKTHLTPTYQSNQTEINIRSNHSLTKKKRAIQKENSRIACSLIGGMASFMLYSGTTIALLATGQMTVGGASISLLVGGVPVIVGGTTMAHYFINFLCD